VIAAGDPAGETRQAAQAALDVRTALEASPALRSALGVQNERLDQEEQSHPVLHAARSHQARLWWPLLCHAEKARYLRESLEALQDPVSSSASASASDALVKLKAARTLRVIVWWANLSQGERAQASAEVTQAARQAASSACWAAEQRRY